MHRPLVVLPLFLLILILASSTAAQKPGGKPKAPGPEEGPLPTIADRVKDLPARPGLLTTYLDADRGRLWVELPKADERGEVSRYLYMEGLVQGMGSNPVGLDRGQLGPTRVVRLRRVGGTLLVEQLNFRYQARSEDPLERRAVAESFATSVLWAGTVAAQDSDGRFLVDFTPFVVRDAHNVARTLRTREQGGYALDPERSALDPAACLSFPDNLEWEAVLTYGLQPGQDPGGEVRSVTPDPAAVTVSQHHSLVRLPDPGFEPRLFHPESGFFQTRFRDYAVPLDRNPERRYLPRHRMKEGEPLTFYLDSGTPEPVRSALLDGARWWARAFEAAGFPGGYRVELLPAAIHPLDARYNVIQWVHRATRGWSYGGGIIDPRTGEIVKGFVTLGSLRVRQDRLLFEGLLGAGGGATKTAVQTALARLRQLAAHEVGHALGLAHNFAASSYGRASVMDYPAPLIRITEDEHFDLSDAYAVGVGAWDVHAIRYGYARFAQDTDETEALAGLRRGARGAGLLFIGDGDARPLGSAHPVAHLWDNGTDPVIALEHAYRVRRLGLERFGAQNVPPGEPQALLHEALVPLYLHHRYQLEAAAKLVGGVDYRYAHREDGRGAAQTATPVPAERQKAALEAILAALEPAFLNLPEGLTDLLLPRPEGYQGGNAELFAGHTGPTFDPLAAAAASADLAVAALLEPRRAARLVEQARRRSELPGLGEVIDRLVTDVFQPSPFEDPGRTELRRSVQTVVTHGLIRLAADPASSAAVRARTEGALRRLAERLTEDTEDRDEGDHRALLEREVQRLLNQPLSPLEAAPATPPVPPGSPIGATLSDCGFGG